VFFYLRGMKYSVGLFLLIFFAGCNCSVDERSEPFDYRKNHHQYAQKQNEKIVQLTMVGLNMISKLDLGENVQKKFFGGNTLKETIDYMKLPYDQKGYGRLEKITDIINGVKTVLYIDNDFSKLASEKFSGQAKYDSYAKSLGNVDDQIKAHQSTVLEQARLDNATRKALFNEKGNNLASLFVTDIYGNAIGEETYNQTIQDATGADLNEDENFDIKYLIPFYRLIEKQGGAPSYNEALENYTKFYNNVAKENGGIRYEIEDN